MPKHSLLFRLMSNGLQSPEKSLHAADLSDAEPGADRYLLDDSQRRQPQRRNLRWTRFLSGLLLLAMVTIAFLSFRLATQPLRRPETGRELGDCGSSAEEARANGCRFDVMSFAWQQPACYYEELVESFKNRAEWHFYSSSALEPADELPLDRVFAGDYDIVYAEKHYHPIHCTYMWRKLHTAYEHGLPVDSSTKPMSHTLHCEKVLLLDYTGEASCNNLTACPTQLRVSHTKCGYH